MNKLFITAEQFSNALDKIYGQVINGVPGTKSCQDVASEYLLKYKNPEKAIKKFSDAQAKKCATSGFLTSIGGVITLPIAIPANLASVLYIQLRAIVIIAIMSGFDQQDDEVQTLAYSCITGLSINNVCKETGIKFANKLGVAAIKKVPYDTLQIINKKLAFKFVTKFGEKGLINLGKMVPLLGGVVGSLFDLVSTKVITAKAKKIFFLGDLD